ncbi:MAG: hypothetical protein N3D74_05030 [Caldisericia bacterium]|nr:hypothetical protein [Caldisericia bacterium]
MNKDRILDIIKNALLLELRGRAFYKKAREDSKIEEVKKIFEIMEFEEEKHIDFLNKQFQNIIKNNKLITINEFSAEFKSIEKSIFEKLIEKINITDYESMAIYIAITFEKEAVNFYDLKQKESKEDSERNIFLFLRDWEKTHVDFLSKIDENLKEKVWFDNKFWPLY